MLYSKGHADANLFGIYYYNYFYNSIHYCISYISIKKDIVTIWKVLTKDKYMLEYIDQIFSNKGVWE